MESEPGEIMWNQNHPELIHNGARASTFGISAALNRVFICAESYPSLVIDAPQTRPPTIPRPLAAEAQPSPNR